MKFGRTILSLFAWLSLGALADEPVPGSYQQLQSQIQAMDQRVSYLEVLVQDQGMLSLLREIEALKREVAALEGKAEVNAHKLDIQGKQQTALYLDLDHRLTDLASRPAPTAPQTTIADLPEAAAPTAPAASSPQVAFNAPASRPIENAESSAEINQFEAALNHFRAANYVGAISGFKEFSKTYPSSSLASNAQYWIGYSYYAMGDYKAAIAEQQALIAAYPGSSKVPDARANIARCIEALKAARNANKMRHRFGSHVSKFHMSGREARRNWRTQTTEPYG